MSERTALMQLIGKATGIPLYRHQHPLLPLYTPLYIYLNPATRNSCGCVIDQAKRTRTLPLPWVGYPTPPLLCEAFIENALPLAALRCGTA